MQKTLLILWASFLMLAQPSFAQNDSDRNPCERMGVWIINGTANTCRLVDTPSRYGDFAFGSRPPILLTSGASGFFELIANGPSITLTYKCGDNKFIKIRSKQSVCGIWGGANVEGNVLDKCELDAQYQGLNGSYWNRNPGELQWTLFDA